MREQLLERAPVDPCAASQYRIDYELFALLLRNLSPWRRNETEADEMLATRCFRLLDDTDQLGVLTFRDLAHLFGIMCCADVQSRLVLLYRLHLPPALLPTDDDVAMVAGAPQKTRPNVEEAVDAIVEQGKYYEVDNAHVICRDATCDIAHAVVNC